jgi:hypothetical protein
MTYLNIPYRRLHNQHLARGAFKKPEDVVKWLGAVQAQDYPAAKWGVAQRMKDATDAALDQAFADGAMLRTHMMRPTWHFVTPADIRWMQALTAPRVHAVNAYQYRKLELDRKIFKRSKAALVKALQGGQQLTRDELGDVLRRVGITAKGQRLAYIIMHIELDAVICSGARRGKQFTYALLDERAPQAKSLERDEALAELAQRFFMSRGPATVKDFAWWSGLAQNAAREGLEMIKSQFMREVVDGRTFWFPATRPPAKDLSHTAYLLPNYDEYLIAYRDHSGVFDPANLSKLVFGHLIVIDGRVVGTWRRTLKKDAVAIETNTFEPLTKAENRAVAQAARQYGAFLDLPVTLV